ncbi:MAG: hypothetical protein Q8S18_10080 [Bacteroidales bacterium]|nr:hypothetical protein [Bacteroidales bacterium]
MKKLIYLSIMFFLLAGARPLAAQNWPEEYLGLPGDNLNLYAVMDLFQQSETLEGFERSLNDPETVVNNLDLNGDNLIDYIMVMDYPDGDVHNIVLRVALNKKEYQDIAVFTVQKFSDGSAQIQLVGDEALYGQNYIVEPIYDETPNPGYTGNTIRNSANRQHNVTIVRTTYYEVASWPVIIYIGAPAYRGWHSSWSWGYYPEYWHPWAPHYWHYYYGYHSGWNDHYYAYYRPWRHHRCSNYYSGYYASYRHHSPTVVININNGNYRNTYSRPEKRKEGETYYAHRVSSGTTVPGRGRSTVNQNSAQSAKVNREGLDRASKAKNETSRDDANRVAGNKRTEKVKTESGKSRESKSTRSAVEAKESPSKRKVNASKPESSARQSDKGRVAPAPQKERNAKSAGTSERSGKRNEPIVSRSDDQSKANSRKNTAAAGTIKTKSGTRENAQLAKSDSRKPTEIRSSEKSSPRPKSEAASKKAGSDRQKSGKVEKSAGDRQQKR